MDAIPFVFMAIGGAIGFIVGRGNGKDRALRAIRRFLRLHPPPSELELSQAQGEHLQSWLGYLQDYVQEDYQN